jgi:hypothetical protein
LRLREGQEPEVAEWKLCARVRRFATERQKSGVTINEWLGGISLSPTGSSNILRQRIGDGVVVKKHSTALFELCRRDERAGYQNYNNLVHRNIQTAEAAPLLAHRLSRKVTYRL